VGEFQPRQGCGWEAMDGSCGLVDLKVIWFHCICHERVMKELSHATT
jgi:hypothetical protein